MRTVLVAITMALVLSLPVLCLVLMGNISNEPGLDWTNAVGVYGMGPNTGANDIPWHLAGANATQTVWDFSTAANHLQLGNTASGDTNDPTNIAAGYSLATDDYFMRSAATVGALTTKTITLLVQGSTQTTNWYSEGNSATNTPNLQIYSFGQKAGISIASNAGSVLASTTTTTNYFDGNWVVVTFVDNLGAWAFYKNGVFDVGGTYTQGTITLDRTAIGALIRTTTVGFITGSVATVILKSNALSAAGIATQYRVIYNSICLPRGLTCAAPTAYYRWERMGEWASMLPLMGPLSFDPPGVRR